MTVFSYFKFMFRLYRYENGRLKSFYMAARDALTPLPF
jgi:hypothetical protein